MDREAGTAKKAIIKGKPGEKRDCEWSSSSSSSSRMARHDSHKNQIKPIAMAEKKCWKGNEKEKKLREKANSESGETLSAEEIRN